MKWNKEVNKAVMECFYRSKPFDKEGKPVIGYRQRMFREWRDRGLFESTEQHLCDQARAIRKNGWLSQLELEAIKRQVEDEFLGEFGEDDLTEVETVENKDTAENEAMVENEFESVAEEIMNAEEVNNNVTDSVDDTRHTLNDEHRKIVERLNEIMLEGKTSDGIMFKKVGKKTLKVQTDRANEAIRYFKSKNITESFDVDRLYVKRKVGGRGLISVERCIREEENSLRFYVANSEENLIRGVSTAETINARETITSVEFKKQREKELKEKWSEKRIHGQFIRQTTEKVDKEKTWQWLSRGDLKVGTEALLWAAQEHAIRTNYIKYHIDKTSDSPMCRLCGKKGESVQVFCILSDWLRKNTKDDTTMLKRKFIGIFVKRTG